MKMIKILFTGISFAIFLLIILNFYKIEVNLFSYAQGAINTLNVESSPLQGILISADKSAYSGRTNYSISTTTIISTWLTAPQRFGSYAFDCWQGCDYVDGNKCSVYVNNGITQEVTAYYSATTTPPPPTFDLSVTSLDIRSFICKNRGLDQSYWNDFSSPPRNPNYPYAPSTTYAVKFYNEVASSTCPESQVNRPVEFSASVTCLQGNCPASKLQIYIRPTDISARPYETQTFESAYNASYPKSIKSEYTFDNAYDYRVTACLVDQHNNPIDDKDNSNNCKEWTLRIFDYFCHYGFAAQSQRDWTQQPPFKILQIFGTTDSPIRYWRNEICKARFGF